MRSRRPSVRSSPSRAARLSRARAALWFGALHRQADGHLALQLHLLPADGRSLEQQAGVAQGRLLEAGPLDEPGLHVLQAYGAQAVGCAFCGAQGTAEVPGEQQFHDDVPALETGLHQFHAAGGNQEQPFGAITLSEQGPASGDVPRRQQILEIFSLLGGELRVEPCFHGIPTAGLETDALPAGPRSSGRTSPRACICGVFSAIRGSFLSERGMLSGRQEKPGRPPRTTGLVASGRSGLQVWGSAAGMATGFSAVLARARIISSGQGVWRRTLEATLP